MLRSDASLTARSVAPPFPPQMQHYLAKCTAQVCNLRTMASDERTEKDQAGPSVGVIGLGIMGGAFADHLATAGVPTFGFDVLQPNLDALEARGGCARRSAREVALESQVIIISLPHVEALEDTLFGSDGLVAAERPGAIVVETSTFPVEAKKAARARLAEAGIAMVDAPVSGTGSQAKLKDIVVFVSGETEHFERDIRSVKPKPIPSRAHFMIIDLPILIKVVS